MNDDYKYGPRPSDETVSKAVHEAVDVAGRIQHSRAEVYKALARELAEALNAMLVMSDFGPKPRKLNEALGWSTNDRLARSMADAALAKAREAGLLA